MILSTFAFDMKPNNHIVYVDNCLVNFSGHSATFACSLLKASPEITILGHQRCNLDQKQIIPIFSMTFGDCRISLPNVADGWVARFSAIRRLTYANYTYFRDLFRARNLWMTPGVSSTLLIANAESRCAFAVLVLAMLYRNQKFVLYFQRGAQNIFRLIGILLRLFHLRNIGFVTETPEMAESWSSVIGVDCKFFPFPIKPSVPLNSASLKSNRTIVFGVLGPPRLEKGFDLVLEAYKKLIMEPISGEFALVVQVVPVHEICEVDAAVAELRALAKEESNLDLIENILSDEEYSMIWRDIDIAVLPYACSAYSLRSSGVLIEAIANGKPVIVTAKTLLASIASQYAASLEISDRSVDDLVRALRDAIKQFDTLQHEAVCAANKWSETFGPQQFLSFITSIEANE